MLALSALGLQSSPNLGYEKQMVESQPEFDIKGSSLDWSFHLFLLD